jgi:hypothetical protein
MVNPAAAPSTDMYTLLDASHTVFISTYTTAWRTLFMHATKMPYAPGFSFGNVFKRCSTYLIKTG